MTSLDPIRPGSTESVLRSLELSPEQFVALARQGFVAKEWRGNQGPYYKLRFRAGGKQHVRYLGRDPERAQRATTELQTLQRPRQLNLELTRLSAEAGQALRDSKAATRPLLAEAGFHFHGFAIRRTRSRPAGNRHMADPSSRTRQTQSI